MLHEIVPSDEELDNAVGEVVDDLLAGSPQAHEQCKSLIRAVSGKLVTDQLIEETSRRIARARAGEEGREASLPSSKTAGRGGSPGSSG